MPNSPTLYAVKMANTPLRYESQWPVRLIVAHASSLSIEEKETLRDAQQCIFDDEGPSSISALNPWWGELTGVHWMVNNCDDEWLGNCQYRRSWNDIELYNMEPNLLYLCHPCVFGYSLAAQFQGGHRFPGVEMTMALANAGKLPFTAEEMAATWGSSMFQGGPMAVADNASYKRLMTVLFDCLWPVWNAYEDDIRQLNGYDKRAMAFLAERLLSGIVQHRKKFLGDIGIQHIVQRFHGP